MLVVWSTDSRPVSCVVVAEYQAIIRVLVMICIRRLRVVESEIYELLEVQFRAIHVLQLTFNASA